MKKAPEYKSGDCWIEPYYAQFFSFLDLRSPDKFKLDVLRT